MTIKKPIKKEVFIFADGLIQGRKEGRASALADVEKLIDGHKNYIPYDEYLEIKQSLKSLHSPQAVGSMAFIEQRGEIPVDSRKGCDKICWNGIWLDYRCGQIEDLKHSDHILLCPSCKEAQ